MCLLLSRYTSHRGAHKDTKSLGLSLKQIIGRRRTSVRGILRDECFTDWRLSKRPTLASVANGIGDIRLS